MQFPISDETLKQHPLVQGLNSYETLQYVTTFNGQAFRALITINIEPIMIMAKDAILLLPVESWHFPKIHND